MAKDTLNLRVEKDVKDAAEKILDELGLSMTAAVTLYLKAIARTRGIPFSHHNPKRFNLVMPSIPK